MNYQIIALSLLCSVRIVNKAFEVEIAKDPSEGSLASALSRETNWDIYQFDHNRRNFDFISVFLVIINYNVIVYWLSSKLNYYSLLVQRKLYENKSLSLYIIKELKWHNMYNSILIVVDKFL